MPQSRQRSTRIRAAWLGSAGVHAVVLLIILFVRLMEPLVPPPEQPSFAVEFEPDTSQTNGGPNPSKDTQTPKGEDSAMMHPQTQPPAAASSQPQMNLIPPEYMQPPPPPQEQAEPLPPPMAQPRYSRTGPAKSADHNPFAHPMNFSLAPRGERSASAGLRSSRGLDLSAGPVVRGGRLQDSVAHVVGPGGTADYLALLSEFIEEHKYYPEGAAANGEEGTATVQLTVARDGTVKALHLDASSGSSLLDAAWMAVFRDNRLPAFTDDMPGAQQTFTLSLNYELIYRH
jgi:protein TonB